MRNDVIRDVVKLTTCVAQIAKNRLIQIFSFYQKGNPAEKEKSTRFQKKTQVSPAKIQSFS